VYVSRELHSDSAWIEIIIEICRHAEAVIVLSGSAVFAARWLTSFLEKSNLHIPLYALSDGEIEFPHGCRKVTIEEALHLFEEAGHLISL